MTYKELVDSVAIRMGKETQEPFKKELYKTISSIRHTLLLQEFGRNNSIPYQSVQTINVTLEPIQEHRLKLFKSKFRIPEPLRIKRGYPPFMYVGKKDEATPYEYIQPSDIPFIESRRFAKQIPPFYFYRDGYLLTGGSTTKKIITKSIWADPLLISDLDTNYNELAREQVIIESDLEDTIKTFLYKDLGIRPMELDSEIKISDAK
jgi:hypothetical protein